MSLKTHAFVHRPLRPSRPAAIKPSSDRYANSAARTRSNRKVKGDPEVVTLGCTGEPVSLAASIAREQFLRAGAAPPEISAAIEDRLRPTSSRRPRGPRFSAIHAPTTGSEVDHMFRLRIELARDAFDDDHRLLQHHKLDPCRHVEQAP